MTHSRSGSRNQAAVKRRSAGRRKTDSSFSGWTGLAIGLLIGAVAVAFTWHYKTKAPAEQAVAKTKEKAPLSAREEAAEPEPPASGEYTFYNKLKNFEVVVPEKEKDVHRDLKSEPETRPGSYFLQVGSYRKFTDADRVRAQLALAGVDSVIQKVSVDSDTWLRIRVGPLKNLDELNRVRSLLRRSDIDALVIRAGD